MPDEPYYDYTGSRPYTRPQRTGPKLVDFVLGGMAQRDTRFVSAYSETTASISNHTNTILSGVTSGPSKPSKGSEPGAVSALTAPLLQQSLKGPRLTLRLIVELSSIVTIMSFLLAAGILAYAMTAAGLPFAQLVSVDDVIVQGLGLLFKALLGGLAVTAVYFPLVWTFTLATTIAGMVARRTLLPNQMKWLLVAAVSIMMAMLIYLLSLWAANVGLTEFFPRGTRTMMGFAIGLTLLAVGVAFVRNANFWILVLACCFCSATITSIVAIHADMRDGIAVIRNVQIEGCTRAESVRVLWSGSSSIAVRCEDGIGVISGPENVSLIRPDIS